MDKKPPKKRAGADGETREARLKAALKANIARRKAQAIARSAKAAGDDKES
ncbi:hypothetical protein DEA8626_04019 [Defluviimonas aquaemixtae]|uniref:Uncharacterized protein n=1 Tax=Albidovulum aquaemixtae TaxID=1542388 RepID=A0A2R8BNJ1_9RHOB|nr:hypothetical protein [Defluviimonas aquaemixtae]SPH24986.1 hypothetical protein DEA8626_04019 [Defluviimonas aquaemixtae]